MSDLSVVWLDVARSGTVAVSFDAACGARTPQASRIAQTPNQTAGQVDGTLKEVRLVAGTSNEVRFLLGSLADRLPDSDMSKTWKAFECVFSNGVKDLIVLRTDEDVKDVSTVFEKLWPGLRRMCIHEISAMAASLSNDAMLWMIRRKMNASILVLDQNCNVLGANSVGRELLDRGDILREMAGGLKCIGDRATSALHKVVSEMFQDGTPEFETKSKDCVLFLRGPKNMPPVPMTLSPYTADGGRTRVLIAMLPMPPDRKRIESFARKMGLTPSEARVAALIRAGHSNREAAKIAGIKAETFNTYAKRVLSKMNVSCRSEMAQMLTWQTSMERAP